MKIVISTQVPYVQAMNTFVPLGSYQIKTERSDLLRERKKKKKRQRFGDICIEKEVIK